MIAQGLATVRQRIVRACAAAGRDPREVTLVAVSKTRPAAAVTAVRDLGQIDFGENRVQELVDKAGQVASVRWHMIGSLQTNKVRQLLRVPGLVLVHSLDRPALADELQKVADKLGQEVHCLIEVNAGDDPGKHSCPVADVPALARHVEAHCPRVFVLGLMAMGPLVEQDFLPRARAAFARTRALRDQLRTLGLLRARFDILSMGMTEDLEVAIAEGATMVRVGTAIFGERPSD